MLFTDGDGRARLWIDGRSERRGRREQIHNSRSISRHLPRSQAPRPGSILPRQPAGMSISPTLIRQHNGTDKFKNFAASQPTHR